MTTDNPLVIEYINKIGKPGTPKTVERLGEIGDPLAVEPLIKCLQKYQKTDQIKQPCSRALLKIGDLRGIKAVLEYGDHFAVLQWMKILTGVNSDWWEISDKEKDRDLASLKAEIEEEWIEPLIEFLKAKNHFGDAKAMIVVAFGNVRDDLRVIEALRNALEDDDAVGLELVVEFGIVIPLLGLPTSGYKVGELAGLSLIWLGDQDSAAQIIHLALNKWWMGDHNPKEKFVQYMYLLGWESVIPTLTQISENFPGKNWKNCAVREKAIACLVAIGDAKVNIPLLVYLNDPVPGVRKKAAQALGKVGDSSALETLERVLKDKKFAVRHEAKKAIKKIKARHSNNLSPS